MVRQRLLARRGFEKMSYGWITRWMRLGSQPLREAAAAPGYSMRVTHLPTAGDEHWADCRRMADLLNAALRADGT
jgi:hypothetical protein